MRLSNWLADQSTWDPDSPPLWLWHPARTSDLTAIRVEGLLPNPHVWLASTKQAALECNPSPDRLVVRVNTSQLDVSRLRLDARWDLWVEAYKAGTSTPPPLELVQWWAHLKKGGDPHSAGRLASVVSTGQFDKDLLQLDLNTQLRLKPKTLWTYQTAVEPPSLSVLDGRSGFYVGVNSFPLAKEERQ